MSTLSAYAAGVSTTGMEVLSDALKQTFGSISITELDKDNVRFNVRMAAKTNAVVLVVLDSGSEDLCKDIIGDLIASDKYYKYSGDAGLIHFLNDKYGLSLEMVATEDVQLGSAEVATTEASDEAIERITEKFTKQLEDKDARIRNLLATIKELEAIIDSGGYSVAESNTEAEDALKIANEEILTLKSKLADLDAARAAEEAAKVAAEGREAELKGKLEAAESARASAVAEWEATNHDLAEAREDASRKSGVIRDKDARIAALEASATADRAAIESAQITAQERDDLADQVASLTGQVSGLEHLKTSYESKISHLKSELEASGKNDEALENYKAELDKVNLELSATKVQLNTAMASLQTARASNSSLEVDLEKAKAKSEELEARVERQDEDIIHLNELNVTLRSRIEVLESSSGRDTDVEALLSEVASLRRKVAELENGIFHKISNTAMPRTASRAKLFVTQGLKYDNIRFVFSGSTESRKGTYRCLRREFSEDAENKYLLVDIVSETFVDYVFEISSVVKGLKWFTDGGGVQPYISSTCLQNVKVLSPGMQYVNDSYFLTMNWEKRLKELNSSGYKVVIYCGDLSNVVGRVIYDTLSEVGTTNIYVHGNSVGSRTMVIASGGVSNIASAIVKYFEYDRALQKFYNLVAKKCRCEIISYSR